VSDSVRNGAARWRSSQDGGERTNVWHKATSPKRGFRRLTSDRQRDAIPLPAANQRGPVAGSALPVVYRPFGVRVERKLNMSCLYSTACVYGVTALTVAIWLIPLLIILWLWRKTPIRRTWVPLLFFLGLIFLIQVVSALIGPNELMALAYILAGAAK
jgi:hypothetical protein